MKLKWVDANDVAVLFVELFNLKNILPSLDTVEIKFVPSRSAGLQ